MRRRWRRKTKKRFYNTGGVPNSKKQTPSSTLIQDKIFNDDDGYKEGAVIGGIIGLTASAYMKKRLLVGALIGVVAGGFIAYQLNKSKKESAMIKFKTK